VAFRAVKAALSLEAVLRRYQVPGLRQRGQQLVGPCPLHGGRREDSFRVSLEKNLFHCFACQAGGTVLDFVAMVERCSLREAALRLQQWFGGGPPGPLGNVRVREKEGENPVLPFTLEPLDYSHPYLVARSICRATATEFGIGFYGGPGLLRGRVVIPIANARGQTVAYAGRAVDGRQPKYLLPAGFRKSQELFNLHRAVATGSRRVIVVEGYFDCLRVHQAGFPAVVALMGLSLSAAPEQVLRQRFESLILLLDGDAAGRAASRALAGRLSARCSLTVVSLPYETQPDQLSLAAIQRLLRDITA